MPPDRLKTAKELQLPADEIKSNNLPVGVQMAKGEYVIVDILLICHDTFSIAYD